MRNFEIPGRSPVFAQNGMCATSHPLATLTAIEILKSGGNALDAAVAAGLVLGLAEPQMNGIGGDAFFLFTKGSENRVRAMNGSGKAPAGLDAETLRAAGQTDHPSGVHSVTLPCGVAAIARVLEDHGQIGLDRVLAPAIHYAEEGIPLAHRVIFDRRRASEPENEAARTHFGLGTTPPTPGTLFRAPGQADVLRRVAKDGPTAFYEGEVAADMVASLQALGGTHTMDDFASVSPDYTDPIEGSYKGQRLIEHPPNGVGAIAILMTHMMAEFDIASMDPFGPERAHLETEATKLAFDARNRFIADPDHTARTDRLLDPATAKRLASLIDPKRVLPDPAPLTEELHKDTVVATVVDRDGSKVSLISSLFSDFGSRIASEKFGILFHNRGSGFNLTPGHPNEAGPGKRPLHTILPAMLGDKDRITMPFAVMGGAYQFVGHARFLTNMTDFGMDAQTAIDAPRAFWVDGDLRMEGSYPAATRATLAAMGHRVVAPPAPIGGAQAIFVHESGLLEGASDPRKDGCALGY
ncbi:MAG: gamma-glutamyltransferase family protein [Pseudomonadota bacterium]